MQVREESRGIGDLLGDLGKQVSTLVRREIELARVEITSSVNRLSRGAILYAGLLVLLAAFVLALIDAGLDGWLAALIVAVVALAIGAIVTWLGAREIKETNLAPAQTAETVRENVEFVKEQMK